VKSLGNIALIIASFFLVGHTLTPHLHEDTHIPTICEQQDSNHNPLVHLFTCFFHTDLGDEHLETYLAGSEMEMGFALPDASDYTIAPCIAKAEYLIFEVPVYSSDGLSAHFLRGPPKA
jgi:hypothetical protein